jgi:hypothetical protein
MNQHMALILALGLAACGGKSSNAGPSAQSFVPLCPGAIELPDGSIPCRGDTCDGECEDPSGPISIGCAGTAYANCRFDDSCLDGGFCVLSEGPCPIAECVPPCTASSCAADQQCGADGKCAPAPCTSGYACAADQACHPTQPGADPHGCVPASCASDGFSCPTGSACKAAFGMDAHGCNVPRCDALSGSCPHNSRCDPSSATPDGCVRLSCSKDTDCDCGACVLGLCENQPFICVSQLE